MIQPMKKITLLCLAEDRKETLDHLAELSVMHLSELRLAENEDTTVIRKRTLSLQRAVSILNESPKQEKKESFSDAKCCLERFETLLEQKTELAKKLEQLLRQSEELKPWGDFDPESLTALTANGISSMLAIVPDDQMPELPESVSAHLIRKSGPINYMIFFSDRPFELKGIAPVVLPHASLSGIESELCAVRQQISVVQDSIAALKGNIPLLEKYLEETNGLLEFVQAECLMAKSGSEIVRLTGYVPVIRLEELQAGARKYGWALSVTDPAADDDQVPTYITKPKWLNIMDPLFDFIGVAPGYRENDVNLFFLIFFPVFFGMIIGDAGYGVLFLICAGIAKIALRSKPAARLPLNLFILLSCFSVTWGWLNGSWLGLPSTVLPGWMQGIDFLTNPAKSPFAIELGRKIGFITASTKDIAQAFESISWDAKIVQWICFFLAAVHLGSARIFKFVTEIRHDWHAFGHFGWALLLIANFFLAVNLIVFPGTFPSFCWWLYGIGTALIVVTISFEDALNLPFALLGSFTDVLSYIRLYAVGLAGTLIAIKFNEMGLMVTNGKHGAVFAVALAALILIVLFGHILNISLNFLSVLVHAIRLNTLEFSNHIGMQWAGVLYKPFKKTNSVKTQK